MSERLTPEEISKLPFMDVNLDVEERVEDLLSRLTQDEKFRLSYGRRIFFTAPIKRLGILMFKMCDGPHGLGATGTLLTKKATAFPVAILRTAMWNPELAYEFGKAAAEEFRAIGYREMLGPGVNIQRTPLCGRTFEYQSEDPYLNSVMGVAVVKGIQSQKVAACVKHYVCNNQELERFKVDAIVSERALREIYLPAFEATVREADAWSFMTCYNKVNGDYGSGMTDLIQNKLFKEWGFRGFVVSDWFATRHMTSTAKCVNAGTSLEMPRAILFKKKRLETALAAGEFKMETYDDNLRRLLRVMFLTGHIDDKGELPDVERNTTEHQAVALKMAEEGIVLLKNDNNTLPLDINKIKKIAVLGPNAKKKHSLGGGSSMIRAFYEITPKKGLREKCEGKIEIVELPSEADVVIFVGGLNHKKHGDKEGVDKLNLELAPEQIEQLNNTIEQNPNTILVLINGSPIAMEGWIDKVPAIVEAWYPGMEGGRAIANVLFGDVNPSGKLTITFPKKLEDSPAHASERTYAPDTVYHDEGIFVGYRHFDKKDIEPLFPFGFGLSYTTFKYDNLKLSKTQLSGDEKLTISVDVTNIGKRAGAEIVQLYIQDVDCSVERPPKELKGFKKVFLEPGKKDTAKMELKKKDLSFWDEKTNAWKAEKGKFKILIGSSSRDIKLHEEIEYLG